MRLVESEDRKQEHAAAMEGRSGMEAAPEQRMQQRFWDSYHSEMAGQRASSGTNVGPDERAVSVAAGAIIGLLGLGRRSLPGLIIAGVGSMLVYRGITGHCGMYGALGLNTAQPDGDQAADEYQNGIQISTAVTINKPAPELYRYWRNFENLPRFMEHLDSVRVIDDRRSHWTVQAPKLVGGQVEWDAEITRDDPDQLIAWRSLPGSSIETAGQVRFEQGLGDRGTEVHVWMNYVPPGGTLGHWVASLLGENPKRVVREELHNFQRLMELGEIPGIVGQPHGTCTGTGKRTTESRWKPLFT